MAQLALGIAGAVVGFMVGGPLGASIGFTLGSAVGGYLFQKPQEGPRLTDLKIQGAAYGTPIPIPYGTIRMAGTVIWQTDLVEHENKSGGKGGPRVTTYSYTASFAVLLADCKAGAKSIIGIKRIWADKRLVWANGQTTGTNTQLPFVLYTGTDDQLPDPTIEADKGAGNVPGYRGYAYIVFTDLELNDYFNRIPQLEFEVHATGDPQIALHAQWPVDYDFPIDASTYSSPYLLNGVEGDEGGVTLHRYRGGNDYGGAAGFPTAFQYSYERRSFDLKGNLLSSDAEVFLSAPYNVSGWDVYGSMNSGIAYTRGQVTTNCTDFGGAASSSINTFQWLKNGVQTFTPLNVCLSAGSGTASLQLDINSSPLYWAGNVYATCSSQVNQMLIRRWPATDGEVLTADHDAEYDMHLYSHDWAAATGPTDLAIGDDGYLYCLISYTGGGSPDPEVLGGWGIKLLKFDKDLNLIQTWLNTDITPEAFPIPGAYSFVVYAGHLIGYYGSGDPHTTFAPIYILWELGTNTLTHVDYLAAVTPLVTPLVYIGNGYAAVRGGILKLSSTETLATIVADISDRCGLESDEYDVTEIPDPVRGFAITNQSSGRSNIEALIPAYVFGAVESDTAVKFRHLNRLPDFTIDDDDLGAHASGSETPPLVATTHALEVDLPRRIFTKYLNVDADYQDGTQIWQKQTTISQLESTLNLPVVMTDGEAKFSGDLNGTMAWLERERHVIFVPRKYAHGEPLDVTVAKGRTMRIVNKDESMDNVIKFDCVSTGALAIFVQGEDGVRSGGFVPPEIFNSQLTDLLLLDIPLLSDTDYPNGYPTPMSGHDRMDWRGAQLLKSADGTNYNALLTATTPDTMGTASTVLADFAGGNIFDETNTVTVVISPGGASLASATEAAVLSGANQALIGDEIIQYKTATLTGTRTYLLSGLLRGRFGTEWAQATHIAGERFVELPTESSVAGPTSEIGASRYFKAVTLGNTEASAAAVQFANLGVALRPYAPVHLGGGSNAAGDVTLTWIRRDRKGFTWQDIVDIPMSESSESYIVQIWDSTYTLCARVITVTAAQTTIYTAAMQTTDFGANQQTIYFTVGQIGSVSLGSQKRGTAAGIGGSNTSPTTPIAPYAFAVALEPIPGPTRTEDHVFTLPYQEVIVPILIGEIWSGKFTAPATPKGSIYLAEYQSQRVKRHAWLSTDSGGLNKVAGSEQYNVSPVLFFGASNIVLVASTVYYFFFEFRLPNGSSSGPVGDNASSIVKLNVHS